MMIKIQSTALLLIGAFALAACGESGEANTQAGQSGADAQSAGMPGTPGMDDDAQSAEATGQSHSGNGDITELSSDSVTIAHGPVESLGWPAMTMTFLAQSGQVLQGLNVGDPVDFQFRQAGEQYLLTSIKKAQR